MQEATIRYEDGGGKEQEEKERKEDVRQYGFSIRTWTYSLDR